MHYGFKRSFGFEMKDILSFWAPKIVLSLLMILSIWAGYKWFTMAFTLLYLIHLVVRQREDIAKTYQYLANRFVRSKSRT